MFTVLLALVAILITILAAVATDFIGRRVLFIGATLVIWCCLMIIGGIGLLKTRSHSINQLTVSVPGTKLLLTTQVFFSLVWRMGSTILGDLGWTYVAETGSMRLRAKTAGFSAAGGVCFGLIFSTTVPYMINEKYANWGLKTCFFVSFHPRALLTRSLQVYRRHSVSARSSLCRTRRVVQRPSWTSSSRRRSSRGGKSPSRLA